MGKKKQWQVRAEKRKMTGLPDPPKFLNTVDDATSGNTLQQHSSKVKSKIHPSSDSENRCTSPLDDDSGGGNAIAHNDVPNDEPMDKELKRKDVEVSRVDTTEDTKGPQWKKTKLSAGGTTEDSHPPKVELNPAEKAQCMKILNGLKWRQPLNIGVFLQPVSDWRILDDYRRKIVNPMDLGTMQSKLERNQYQTTSDFMLDLRRVFANSLIYNTVGNPYRRATVACLETAEQLASIYLRRPPHEIAAYPPLLFCWKLCLSVLDTLQAVTNPSNGMSTALYFLHPVSVFNGGQFPPDYLTKVVKPMDFGTVTKHLIEGHYVTTDQFEADCRLVLDNCVHYFGGKPDGVTITEQANRLRPVLQKQMSVLKKHIKSELGEALQRSAQNAVTTTGLLEPPLSLLQQLDAELDVCRSDVKSPEQQEEGTRMQANRIKDLEADLKLKELEIRRLKNDVSERLTAQLQSDQLTREGNDKGTNAEFAEADTQNLQATFEAGEKERLQKQMNELILENGNLRSELKKQKLDNDNKQKKIEVLKTEAVSKKRRIENQSKHLSNLQNKLKESKLQEPTGSPQKQLDDAIQENGTLRVTMLVKDLAHQKECFHKQVNEFIRQNGSIGSFHTQEQSIKHQIDLVNTQLRRLRQFNKNKLLSQFNENLEMTERSIATLKGFIRKLIDGIQNLDATESKATEGAKVQVLEVKLTKALQEQSEVLESNQQLRRDKQRLQETIEEQDREMERLREENEQFEEEMEQMKMNHALEVGFLEGSS